MSTVLVQVHVRPEFRDAFIAATRINFQQSRNEPGNLRFDLLQAPDEPDRFILYEAYRTEEDARAHKETAHYLLWRETVAPMMAEPRAAAAWVLVDG
jgi:autoinducer 2-degrading protein